MGMKSNLTLRLNVETNAKIKFIAKRESRSASNLINFLLSKEIERYEAEFGAIPLSEEELYPF